uniref:Uncharacterized protein n=1 Tax=Panagrolaimus sp. ES5 TaxID=591445 RepID=A0AC34GCI8_9BILA
MDDSDLPYLSSDFEISKLQNSSKKKKKRKHKSPLSKKFRKINQSTTVTERKAVKETLPFQSRNPFTSIKATTIPTSRIVTSENTVDHLYFKPTNPKHPKKWKRRMSPFSDISSKDNSLTSFASPSSLSNVIPTTSQSSTTFTEFDTDMENNEDDETTATTSTTRTPKIVEIETSELETTTSTTATSTIPTESSKASTPIITEPDENTERTQSPLKNGIQSPTSISVEMTSPPPSITAVQKKKEKTKIGCRPKVVAEVVQVLAKYKESDVRRLPNERFELINEEESPKKHLTKSSSPAAITTTSTKSSSPSAVTSSTVTTKSSPLASTKSSTSPSSTQVDLFNTAQIAAPQFSPGPPRTL